MCVSNLCQNVYNQSNTLKLYKVKTLEKRDTEYLVKISVPLFYSSGLETKIVSEEYIIFLPS